MEISVAICTYNRAESLRRVLKSLSDQHITPDLSWELLLMDNNSTDGTASVAEEYLSRLPLRYHYEADQGLSAARNHVLRAFTGDLLIFTDDDVVLDVDWVSAYAKAERAFPEADYFGGRILPRWEGEAPGWLRDPSMPLLSGLLVHYDQGAEDRAFTPSDPLPCGANFALRRRLIDRLEPFRLDLGVKGGSVGRGEETEYLGRARATGAVGAYVGSALCLHTQDSRRFRLPHLYRYGIEKGRAAALIDAARPGRRTASIEYVAKGLYQLLKGRGDRFRQCVINIGIQRGLRLELQRQSGSQPG